MCTQLADLATERPRATKKDGRGWKGDDRRPGMKVETYVLLGLAERRQLPARGYGIGSQRRLSYTIITTCMRPIALPQSRGLLMV